jgi:hypothetical protein
VDGKTIPLEGLTENNGATLKYNIVLPTERETRVSVAVETESAYRIPGMELFMTAIAPIEDLMVIIQNRTAGRVGDLHVEVMHPNFNELKSEGECVWRFARPLLPGQGFVVSWQPPSVAASAGTG